MTAQPANRLPGRWLRLAAVLVVVLYLAVLAASWTLDAHTGDDGTDVRFRCSPEASAGFSVVIVEVWADGPAERAGLHSGDVVLAVNEIPLSDFEGVRRAFAGRRPGDQLTYRIQRADAGGEAGASRPTEDASVTLQSLLAWPVVAGRLAFTVVGLVSLGVAVIVVLARPGELAARLLLVAAGSFATLLALRGSDVWPIEPWLEQVIGYGRQFSGQVAAFALLHLFLAFPAPHPLLTRLRAFGPAALRRVGGGTGVLYVAPVAIELALIARQERSRLPGNIVSAVVVVVAILALLSSYRRPQTAQVHAQLKWMLWPLVAGLAALLTGFVVPQATGAQLPWWFPYVANSVWVFLPISIAIAILRYRLFDIDIIIRRTLVYSVLTAALTFIYLSSVVLLQGLSRALIGQGQNPLVTVLSTLAIAALFVPLRRRVQGAIDRRFYRRKYDAAKTLADFAATVRDETDLDRLTARLVEVVQETMQPAHVWLWLKPAADRRPQTAAGARQIAAVGGQPSAVESPPRSRP